MSTHQLAVVVIGRNEGERLRACIDALVPVTTQVIYVDSGSTDGSVQMVRSRQLTVVDLDMSRPFSAARARNEGFKRMRELYPDVQYVQFVDGDCLLDDEWLRRGMSFLDSRSDVVAVYGTLTERHPDKSIYIHFSQLTWNPPNEGEVEYFGGNVMVRVAAVAKVGGFREHIIDSEDHDLAIRLRQQGGKIWYLKSPMAMHDLAVYEFSRWWIRAKRGGYGHGQIVTHHANTPGRPHHREWRRVWMWGLGVPLVSLVATLLFGWIGLVPLLLYPLSFLRMYLKPKSANGRDAKYASLVIASYFAEMLGQVEFLKDKMRGIDAKIIEYK